MYDIMSKLYKSYNANKNAPNTIAINNSNKQPLFNNKIKEYANELLKKSIQKIDDQYKDPNYKLKLIVAKALNENKNKNKSNISNALKLFAGATTISFSLYLVYSFMKR